MKENIIGTLIVTGRLLISAALVAGVYSETGKWTATAITVLLISSEVISLFIKKVHKSILENS